MGLSEWAILTAVAFLPVWVGAWVSASLGQLRATIISATGVGFGLAFAPFAALVFHFLTGGEAGLPGECVTCRRNDTAFTGLYVMAMAAYLVPVSYLAWSPRIPNQHLSVWLPFVLLGAFFMVSFLPVLIFSGDTSIRLYMLGVMGVMVLLVGAPIRLAQVMEGRKWGPIETV